MIVDSDSDGEGGGEKEDAGMDKENLPKFCSYINWEVIFSWSMFLFIFHYK